MSGTKLPAVRLSAVIPAQSGDKGSTGQDAVVVEIPPSNNFGFAWPAAQPAPIPPLPLAAERLVSSGSEGESDVSEGEHGVPARKPRRAEQGDEADFATPTNSLNHDQNPMDQAGPPPALPRLSRAVSMPLPSQLGSLQNPRRSTPFTSVPSPLAIDAPDQGHFQELSLELADSVQMAVQTLLQLSPPQVLDAAKEQFSACSLAIPTTSMSALFTSMKNLNYISANMHAFGSIAKDRSRNSSPGMADPARLLSNAPVLAEFDVGEMLQSIGDALGGLAAQAGVDIVLIHGDVGMKHVVVKGDECGLSYILMHVIRQVISTAHQRETIEVEMFVGTGSDFRKRRPSTDEIVEPSSPTALENDDDLHCIFHIAHRYNSGIVSGESEEASSVLPLARPRPSFDSLILRRLLRHLDASLESDLSPRGGFNGRACEVSVVLPPGSPQAANPTITFSAEDPVTATLGSAVHIANEPTLEQLSQFAETLRGKKVTLHANSRGSFAHHLSSYLTAWGMDVSHVSTKTDAGGVHWLPEGPIAPAGGTALPEASPSSSTPSAPVEQALNASASIAGAKISSPTDALSFVMIDDDVETLLDHLQKLKVGQPYPLTLNARKRPSLANNHRPRSSPQVTRVMGVTPSIPAPVPQVVVVHFTSLSNFKLVKDAIQSSLTSPAQGSPLQIPEVIVIPKPAGPRRFLTALHTAVTKPVVDPFFAPIATSPVSPGFHGMSPFFGAIGVPKSPGARPPMAARTGSDRSAKSPKELAGDGNHSTSSPAASSDNVGYFSDAVVPLGESPSTGLVIQSPDGYPAGIFFHPKSKTAANPSASSILDRDRPEGGGGRSKGAPGRVVSGEAHRPPQLHGGDTMIVDSAVTPRLVSRPQTSIAGSENSAPSMVKGKGRQGVIHVVEQPVPVSIEQKNAAPPLAAPEPPIPQGGTWISGRRTSNSATPPSSPQLRPITGPSGVPRRTVRRPTAESRASAPAALSKKGKSATDNNIVPPISVLIVDDNPINQTILSTFMRKKRIKYDVANNGEEAVQKWRSGVFHLILMDIQMPVMDGIQATKEIRKLEKQTGAGGLPGTPQSDGQRTPSDSSSSTPSYRSSVIIVALTASSLQADRVAALAAGCNDFLTKPVTLQWLNSKIIEWGSIKALQMWADIRPDVVKTIHSGQAAKAQHVARHLHVPEGRCTPTTSRSRSSSLVRRDAAAAAKMLANADKGEASETPPSDGSPPLATSAADDSRKFPRTASSRDSPPGDVTLRSSSRTDGRGVVFLPRLLTHPVGQVIDLGPSVPTSELVDSQEPKSPPNTGAEIGLDISTSPSDLLPARPEPSTADGQQVAPPSQ